jgi:cytochrome P450
MPLLSWIPTPTRRRYRRAVRRLDQIIYEIIAARRAQPGDGEDLLGRLLTTGDETGAVMTDQQLRDELLTLFLAGHETTALTLSFAFYLLSVNPAAAARLTAELDEVLGSRSPTAADVPRLRYAGWVIHESMRLYPPAWSIGREAVADCEIGGYPVPKGTQLALVQWLVHRDARWFEDPDAFRPERWDKDLVRRLPRCAYFPFGDGPRVCIGNHFALLEATLLLATVLQRFQLEMAPGATLRLVPSMTLRPAGGLRMVVRERAYR